MITLLSLLCDKNYRSGRTQFRALLLQYIYIHVYIQLFLFWEMYFKRQFYFSTVALDAVTYVVFICISDLARVGTIIDWVYYSIFPLGLRKQLFSLYLVFGWSLTEFICISKTLIQSDINTYKPGRGRILYFMNYIFTIHV